MLISNLTDLEDWDKEGKVELELELEVVGRWRGGVAAVRDRSRAATKNMNFSLETRATTSSRSSRSNTQMREAAYLLL